jgi:ribosomal protein S18 acetylase RimI-like enzyme
MNYYNFIIKKKNLFEQFAPKSGGVVYRKMKTSDLDKIEEIIPYTFHRIGDTDYVMSYTLSRSDLNKSFVAEVDGNIAGFFFIGDSEIPALSDYKGSPMEKYFVDSDYHKDLINLNGAEGVALGVNPEYKGYNIGVGLLRYMLQNSNYDYMWGGMLTSLQNINFWKRRSKVFFDSPDIKMTYALLR